MVNFVIQSKDHANITSRRPVCQEAYFYSPYLKQELMNASPSISARNKNPVQPSQNSSVNQARIAPKCPTLLHFTFIHISSHRMTSANNMHFSPGLFPLSSSPLPPPSLCTKWSLGLGEGRRPFVVWGAL